MFKALRHRLKSFCRDSEGSVSVEFAHTTHTAPLLSTQSIGMSLAKSLGACHWYRTIYRQTALRAQRAKLAVPKTATPTR